MIKITKIAIVALLWGALVAGVSGCKKEGSAERAGREIDKSVKKAGEEIKKAGEKMKEAIHDKKK